MESRFRIARMTKRGRSMITVAVVSLAMVAGASVFSAQRTFASAMTRVTSNQRTHPRMDESSSYPVGVLNSGQPSGMAPPGPAALAHYTLSYSTNFPGTSLPRGWLVFTGVPGGDPDGKFAASHVVVQNGMLQLETWRDPAYQNRWVTGGLCQCGHLQQYGAYFVRSRLSGSGPNQVELLWPGSNTWPPEIDFNETLGAARSTTASLHWGTTNHFLQRQVTIDMTKWHTWGVVWTPNSVIYTVDGRVWTSVHVTSEVPHIPMRLDFEQRAMCAEGRQCPTVPVTMYVDWVAEYRPLATG